MLKTCKVCNLAKDTTEFCKEPRNVDGLGSKCKKCFNTRQRELYPTRPIKRTGLQYEYHKKWNNKNIYTLKGWVSLALMSCKQRKDCSLTRADILNLWEKQKGLCAVTGEKLILSTSPRNYNRPSIDRLDNSKGYHIDNIRIVWHFVNQARNTLSDETFFKLCAVVVNANRNSIKELL